MVDDNANTVLRLESYTYPFMIDSNKVDDLVYAYDKVNGDTKITKAINEICDRWEELRMEYNEAVNKRYELLKSLVGGFYKMTVRPNTTYEEIHYIFLYRVLFGNTMMFYIEANADHNLFWCGLKENTMDFSDENLRKEIVFERISKEEFLQITNDGIEPMLEHRIQKMNEKEMAYNVKLDF